MTIQFFPVERSLLILGIAAGIGGLFAARSYLEHAERAAAARYAEKFTPRKVLVAASPLQPGDALAESKLAVRNMPQRFLPSSAVPAEDLDRVLNATVLAALQPGDPVETNLLRSAPPSMALRLPAGYRGLALSADSLGPIGAILKAGDHIDLWIETADIGPNATQSNRVVPDVTVLAVDYGIDSLAVPGGDRVERSISLLVAPSDAATIVEALRNGGVAAALRSSVEPPQANSSIAELRASRTRHSRPHVLDVLELFVADGQSVSRHVLAVGAAP